MHARTSVQQVLLEVFVELVAAVAAGNLNLKRFVVIHVRGNSCHDPMRGARVDKADLLNVLMKTRLTLDVSLWDRTIGYCGGTA